MAVTTSNGLDRAIDEALAIGVHVLSREVPGLAIPLFGFALNSNAKYIQTVINDRVVGFEFTTSLMSQTVSLSEPFEAIAQGDHPLHAVVDTSGGVLVGNQAQLASRIRPWLKQVKDPLTRLSLAEFCDAKEVAFEAARATYSNRLRTSDEQSALDWFVNVVVFRRIADAALKNSGDSRAFSLREQLLEGVEFSSNKHEVFCHLPTEAVDILFPGDSIRYAQELLMVATNLDLQISTTLPKEHFRPINASRADLDRIYHDLLSSFDDLQWPLYWLAAWKTEVDRWYLVLIAYDWLSQARGNFETSGLIVATLLSMANSYAPEKIKIIASDWLFGAPVQTPRWANIWARTAKLGKLPAALEEKSLQFILNISRGGGKAHNIWTYVWSTLWARRADFRSTLSVAAADMLPALGNRALFYREVVSVLVTPELESFYFVQELKKWFGRAKKRGRGWALSISMILRLGWETHDLSALATQWLANSEMSSLWASVWLSLAPPSKINGELIEIAIEKLRNFSGVFQGIFEVFEALLSSPTLSDVQREFVLERLSRACIADVTNKAARGG